MTISEIPAYLLWCNGCGRHYQQSFLVEDAVRPHARGDGWRQAPWQYGMIGFSTSEDVDLCTTCAKTWADAGS